MARKKTTEPQESNETVIEATTTAETETSKVAPAEPNIETEAMSVETTVALQETEMSDAAKSILKTFSDHKEIWISKFGGVYVSKPSTSVEAILYKNPYFKS